jgi:hypothetical protein
MRGRVNLRFQGGQHVLLFLGACVGPQEFEQHAEPREGLLFPRRDGVGDHVAQLFAGRAAQVVQNGLAQVQVFDAHGTCLLCPEVFRLRLSYPPARGFTRNCAVAFWLPPYRGGGSGPVIN